VVSDKVGVTGFSPETAGGGRAEKRPGAVVFQGGGGASVVGEGVDESYSWRRGRGR
jgi:hypothetical protein